MQCRFQTERSFEFEEFPPNGRRKRLARVFSRIVDAFSGRVMPLDMEAATESARLRRILRRAGTPISPADSHIAGAAGSRGLSRATLEVQDFHGIELTLVDPRRAA